jgi:protein-disulfide isomerase
MCDGGNETQKLNREPVSEPKEGSEMRKFIIFGALLALITINCDYAFSQTSKELSDLKSEINALKTGQLQIQKDLLEIKNLLLQKELQAARDASQGKAAAPAQGQASAQAPTEMAVINIAEAPFKGDKNAKVTLVEFTDYQCPFCSRHFRNTSPQIEDEYIKTGKLKYVLKDLPLESIHPFAFKAAEAANCAGEQGKYWEMHDRLFSSQNALASQQLPNHAEAIGLDTGKFTACLDSGKYASKIRKDMSEAQQAGVTGTPVFFLGLSDPKSTEVKTSKKLLGARPYASFKEAIDSLLAAK